MKIYRPMSSKSLLFLIFILSFFTLIFILSGVKAEGSKEITSSGGSRAHLEYSEDSTAGIERKNIIYVYVNGGEKLFLGSSTHGLGEGVIQFKDPNGVEGQCAINGNVGVIQNRQEELIGPYPGTGGYTPCEIVVQNDQEGVWGITFVSPAPDGGQNQLPIPADANWVQEDDVISTAAWDVTVMSIEGDEAKGRAFANYLALNMGSFEATMSPEIFLLLKGGLIYSIDLNGSKPFGFIFFGNNTGFLDKDTGKRLYKSIPLDADNNDALPDDVIFHHPDFSDTEDRVTHKLFFNYPSADLPEQANTSFGGTTWLLEEFDEPEITDMTFVGKDGVPYKAKIDPRGGYFIFNSTINGHYKIILDLNNDGVYGNGNDRVLLNYVDDGEQRIEWDGLDGDGVPVPVGETEYNANITFYVGEVHFPFFDVEGNEMGMIFKTLNYADTNFYTIFYDDGDIGGDVNNFEGEDSSGGGHKWDMGDGDHKGIDTWAYMPVFNRVFSGRITIGENEEEIPPSSPNVNEEGPVLSDTGRSLIMNTLLSIILGVFGVLFYIQLKYRKNSSNS